MGNSPAGGDKDAAEVSVLAPLRHRAFALLWIAATAGNIGMWVRDATSGWVMTGLAPGPVYVALVQAAAMLPVFALSLPAGAIGDIVDRRKMMIAVQLWLFAVGLTFAGVTWAGMMSAELLLALTVCAGVGTAMTFPVWQAVISELVPRSELRLAIALNGVGINVSRAVGPAIAGAVVATAGAAAAYLIDVSAYVLGLAVLLWWPRRPTVRTHPERFGSAIRAGLRYARRHPPLKRTILRSVLFLTFASVLWALLPAVARDQIGTGPAGYGILLGALGAGAVCGAMVMQRVRRRFGTEKMVLAGSLVYAAAVGGLALTTSFAVAFAAVAVAGAAWVAVLTAMMSGAQQVLPDWVRARGLAVYRTFYFGAMTGGSILWGVIAQHWSLSTALIVVAASATVAALVGWWLPLPAGEQHLDPAPAWAPPPKLPSALPAGVGRALVTIEYRVPRERQAEFLAALQKLSVVRRRDGAVRWGAYVDIEEPEWIVESFETPSWEEHLRQHQRGTVADARLQAEVQAFHVGGRPVATHLVQVA
jgi:MFS family permease